ncbi:glycosyltransferase family 4 protein [Providencia rettgeri]|uniref:glycosyltransferase family 4 protein n=1 Tax=Providencia sp. PROV272 TaxID=2936800 RepID=UPI0034E6B445
MKKVLLISNMYPSNKYPYYGIFVHRAEDSLSHKNIQVSRVVLNEPSSSFKKKIFNYIIFYVKIIYVCLFKKNDFIYAHYISHCALPILIAILFKPKLKIVTHVHGGDIKYHKGRKKFFFKLKSTLSKMILVKSNSVISPSLYYKELLIKKYNVSQNKIIIYPSGGVDLSKFSFSPRLGKPLKLGFAGRLVESKNVSIIIDVIKQTNNENITCEIVGYGPMKDELMEKVSNLNLCNNFTFLAPKSTSELALWYKNIDILIYPSEAESLGLVPLEAMASGTIVVLSKIPAFEEYINNSKNGFLCSDINEYVDVINMLMTFSNKQLNQIRYSALETVKNNYCSNKVSERLYESFR